MTTQLKHTLALFFVVFAFACQQYRPLIDPKGLDAALLEQHMGECEALVQQAMNSGASPRAPGALLVVPAVFAGAVTGAVVDRDMKSYFIRSNYNSDLWSIFGAVAGLFTGIYAALQHDQNIQSHRKTIMDQCMEKRGYDVIQY